MEVDTLIESARAAAEDDESWLGSDAHRSLIEEFAASRVAGTRVIWLRPGDRSYTKGRTIAMERPAPCVDVDTTVETLALMAFHEVLHLAHSDSTGAPSFAVQLGRLPPSMRRLGESLFNYLEDARVAYREHQVEPSNDRYLNKLHELSVQ